MGIWIQIVIFWRARIWHKMRKGGEWALKKAQQTDYLHIKK